MSLAERLRAWARGVKRDVTAVWLAARDPRTPWPVRLAALAVAAYALSPVDLIPDFIPVLGLLDDAVVLPLGVLLVVRLIGPERMREHRAAADALAARPVSRAGAAAVVLLWAVAAAAAALWLLR